MDENKTIKLKEIGYLVRRNCGNCKSGKFRHSGWGTCGSFTYKHLKHSDEERDLSINRDGYCKSHQWDDLNEMHNELHGFVEFVEE